MDQDYLSLFCDACRTCYADIVILTSSRHALGVSCILLRVHVGRDIFNMFPVCLGHVCCISRVSLPVVYGNLIVNPDCFQCSGLLV